MGGTLLALQFTLSLQYALVSASDKGNQCTHLLRALTSSLVAFLRWREVLGAPVVSAQSGVWEESHKHTRVPSCSPLPLRDELGGSGPGVSEAECQAWLRLQRALCAVSLARHKLTSRSSYLSHHVKVMVDTKLRQ